MKAYHSSNSCCAFAFFQQKFDVKIQTEITFHTAFNFNELH